MTDVRRKIFNIIQNQRRIRKIDMKDVNGIEVGYDVWVELHELAAGEFWIDNPDRNDGSPFKLFRIPVTNVRHMKPLEIALRINGDIVVKTTIEPSEG